MSSAANHRARSRRSHYRHASAMNGVRRNIITQSNRSSGRNGTPLIYRLQAFHRWMSERKQKDAPEQG